MENTDNYDHYIKVQNVVKDIIFMYYTLINYNYLFDDFSFEYGDFDPLEYIDLPKQEFLDLNKDEYHLIHCGSAIKIICMIFQAWSQGGHPNIRTEYFNFIQLALNNGRLDHIPELKDLIYTALENYDQAWDSSHEIYKKYVLGFIKKLLVDAESRLSNREGL